MVDVTLCEYVGPLVLDLMACVFKKEKAVDDASLLTPYHPALWGSSLAVHSNGGLMKCRVTYS